MTETRSEPGAGTSDTAPAGTPACASEGYAALAAAEAEEESLRQERDAWLAIGSGEAPLPADAAWDAIAALGVGPAQPGSRYLP